MAAAIPCYLGIDVGTQGLTALLAVVEEEASSPKSTSLRVLAIGEGSYGFVPSLPEGCYEHDPLDWETALLQALQSIRESLQEKVAIQALCVTGQMHGCCMIDPNGKALGTARLWCDARNQEEADRLTRLFGERMPKRLTAARYLWSLQHEPHKTHRCVGLTTPAGYLTHKLTTTSTTNELVLGVGEASGMFPVEPQEDSGRYGYRTDWIEAFDGHVRSRFPEASVPSLRDLLPEVRTAGDIRRAASGGDEASSSSVVVMNRSVLDDPKGWLYEVRDLFGDSAILVAPAEGDQPTALAASLIGEHGMISCSFGTSVVANMVGKSSSSSSSRKQPPKQSSSSRKSSVDKFNAVNGQPISMVWLRNGTTYLNNMVDSYGGDFEGLLRQALEAPADCGGLLALPFLDDEPGHNVARGGTGMILGFNSTGNHQAGNVIKAAMVSVMFNLYLGAQQVEAEETADDEVTNESSKKEIVLTGGLTKTPETGQILANIFDRPVRLLEAADEGGAWGAALLATYAHQRHGSSALSPPPPGDWLDFLATVQAQEQQSFSPQPEQVPIYRSMLEKYKQLLELQPQLDRVMNGLP